MRVLIASTFAACLLSAGVANACSCIAPPPPKVALENSAAVFAGKVKSVKRDGVFVFVTFEISRTWKGTKGKTVSVRTPASSAACGYGFKTGTAYLVYCPELRKAKPAKLLSTSICTRTKTLASAKADLKELGDGKKP